MKAGLRAQLVASQAFGQLAPLLVVPLLTRSLGPEQMGVYQVSLSIALVALPFSVFQADIFLPIARDEKEVATLKSRAVLATLLVGAIAAFAAATIAANRTVEAAITSAFLLTAMSFTAVGNATLIRKDELRKLVQRNLLGGVLVAILQTFGAVFHPTATAIGASMLLGRMLSQLLLRSNSKYEIYSDQIPVQISFRSAFSGASASALGTIASQMPTLAVAPMYGAIAAGYLGLGQRVVGAPVGLIGQGINQTVVSDAAEVIRSDKPLLWAHLKIPFFLLFLLSVGSALAIATVVAPFTSLIFGPDWTKAGRYIQLLALPMCLQLVAIPAVSVMTMLGLQRKVLTLQVFRIAGVAACIGAGYILSFGMHTTVFLISVIWTVAYLILLVSAANGIRKYDTNRSGSLK